MFTATSTADEVIEGIDLTGRRAIVTGGASGIGVETARALAGAGAEVTLAVRDREAGGRTADDIIATTGNRQVTVRELELTDPASIARFLDAWTGPLNILVNNAGVMAAPLTRTPQGWELQFATNHLGHFALTTGLQTALKQGAQQGKQSRVVSVSSAGHLRSPLVEEDIHFERREYDPWDAYGQSKTANILFAVELTRQWAGDGITANSLHPGGIRTNLQRHITEEDLRALGAARFQWKNTEQGAATSVLVATSPLLEGIGGRYFEDCAEAGPNQQGERTGVAAYALDPEAAARLWKVSEETVGQLIRADRDPRAVAGHR
jgi:NAD(P)-dependent dehydrogenase (short-subunit alcohol dehydrogenase family)